MRLTLPRLLALALPLAALAGCGTTSSRSCGGDTDYLQAVERPPIQLPPEVTPTERIQPMQIPAVDPNPQKLDPQPRCLDEPPKFFARKAAVADPAEEAVRVWAWASRKTDTVLQMYSARFRAAGEGGAAAFLEQRRQQIETGRPPEPKLEDVAVTAPAPDRRVVTFVQRFGEGAVRKELTLALEGQLWRIVAERTLGML